MSLITGAAPSSFGRPPLNRFRTGLLGVGFLAAAVVLAPASAATAAAQAPASTPTKTVARTYDPWARADKLAPGIGVARTVKGYCWVSSIAVSRANAYRCMTGNEIYDPCFSPPAGVSGVVEVACAPSPWSKVVLMRLTRRLPKNTGGRPHPWAFRLADGDGCVVGTGANGEVDGVVMPFYCTVGLTSAPDEAHEPWTVRFAGSYKATRLQTERVSTAWY